MPPKNSIQIVLGAKTSNRLVSKPESLIKAGATVGLQGSKRKTTEDPEITAKEEALGLEDLTESAKRKPKKCKQRAMLVSSSSSELAGSESSPESDSESDAIVEEELLGSIDNLSRSASSMGVKDAVEVPLAPPVSLVACSTPTKLKMDGDLPSKDLLVQEGMDWAKDAAIADAKLARKEARKAKRKEKTAKAKAAKLAQLEAGQLAGKPLLRKCLHCKTLHWEQTG